MEIEKQRRLFNQCDPKEPLPTGDDRYEPFDEKQLRGEPARLRLLRTIRLSGAPTTQLFTGLLGSGKSTELRRLADDVRQEGLFVAMANVVERDSPLLARARPMDPAELLYAVCHVVDEALSSVHVQLRSRLDDLWRALNREIRLEPALKLGPAEVKVRFADAPDFRAELARRARAAPQTFKRAVDGFIERACAAVVEYELGRGLLVVVDGLEKVADAEVDTEACESTFREVFLSQAESLRLPCHAVYPVAPFMIQHGASLGALYDAEPVVLPMVRVRGRNEELDEAGVTGLVDALHRRGLRTAFADEECLREVVLASGGYLRDLMRLVREALLDCPEDNATIDREGVKRAVRRIRRTYREGLFEEFREPLRLARRRKAFDLDDHSRPLMARLLRAHLLLRYHNADEWYDAHPLMWDELGTPED